MTNGFTTNARRKSWWTALMVGVGIGSFASFAVALAFAFVMLAAKL